ncbi:glycosyltransferase [Pedobacter sp.]
MMTTDKILIYTPFPYDINKGGPPGFIAHNLVDVKSNYFILSNHLIPKSSFLNKVKYKIFEHVFNETDSYFDKIKANRYKYLYFHDCLSFYSCRKKIKSSQIVIFQSHSPELPSEEVKSFGDNDFYELVKKAEIEAFDRADILVFPNSGAEKIYETVKRTQSETKYILSGAKSVSDIRRYPLDKEKINVLYIGRRNQVKGFDMLLNQFSKVSEFRKNINLIIVGNGEKINGTNIYDVGFSSTPNNWYNSVDYVINCNRQSYFDLSVIEALSTGVPLIMTDNFGHEYYRDKSKEIITFDSNSPEQLFEILTKEPLKKRDYETKENINLYKNELSNLIYINRLESFVKEIL